MTQPRPLNEQLKALEHLQELDLKIDVLKKNKGSFPAALKVLDDGLNRVRLQLQGKQKELDESEKVLRQTRAAMDLNRDRMARSSGRLEGVQNSQEFQAANKEIDQLKKMSGNLEEQQKKSETEAEAIRKVMGELTAQLEALQKERDEKASQLSGQSGQIDGEVANLTDQRTQYTSQVDPRILAQYDRVRVARGGLGLVPAMGGRCKGCNMMVPPQLYNEVQRGTNVQACPSCHRIMFIPAQPVSGQPNG